MSFPRRGASDSENENRRLPFMLLELSRLLERLNHIAGYFLNANHSVT